MKTARFACSFAVLVLAILLIVLITGQSSPVVLANQKTALPHALKLLTGVDAQLAQASKKPPVRFAPTMTYRSGGWEALSIAIGELNGDGHPDLVVANFCQSDENGVCNSPGVGVVDVLLGNGDGTFRRAVGYSSGGYRASSVAIGDLNGDGHPDLVVTNLCQIQNPNGTCNGLGAVDVLMGNGDGTFQPAVSYSTGGYRAASVALEDVNGDGHTDVVVANSCQSLNPNGCNGPGGVSVLLGNGDGTFQPAVNYSSGGVQASSVAIADVNGDGTLDLVVTNGCGSLNPDGSCNGDGEVGVLLGNRDGTFQSPVVYGSGGDKAVSVALGDVNGDGYPDLVLANLCLSSGNCNNGGGVSVLLGNGDGTFRAPVSYNSGAYLAQSVEIGDVNGDGRPDLVVANRCRTSGCKNSEVEVSVLVGNGDGTFQAPVRYSAGGYGADSIAIGDLTGDGKLDVVVSDMCIDSSCLDGGSVGVLLNNLTATTTTKVTSSLNPALVNQSVTFTATVTSNIPVANGATVAFYNGAIEIGTGTTTSGVATLTTSFSKSGTHTIIATYSGDAFHKASSGTVKQVVNH